MRIFLNIIIIYILVSLISGCAKSNINNKYAWFNNFRPTEQKTTLSSKKQASSTVNNISSSMSLRECIDISLQNNPELTAMHSDRLAAQAKLDGAKSVLWPKLALAGGYTHYKDKIRLVQAAYNGEPGLFTNDIASGDIIVTLPIFSGGRDWNTIRAADLLELAAKKRMAFSQEELIFNVTSLYFTIMAQKHIIESLAFSRNTLIEQIKHTEALVKEEKAAHVDVLRSQVHLADIEEKLIAEKNIYSTTRLALINMMGVSLAEQNLHLKEELAPSGTVSLPKEQNLTAILDKRADYKAARHSLEAQGKSIKVAEAGFWPSISFKGSYGQRQAVGPTLSASDIQKKQSFDLKNNAEIASVGIYFEYPLFDGGTTAAKVREEKAKFTAAKQRLLKLEKQIELEVRTSERNVRSAVSRIEATQMAVAQAKESLRIEIMKYNLGSGTILDTLEAQDGLLQAQVNYYRALADYHISFARMRLATGETL